MKIILGVVFVGAIVACANFQPQQPLIQLGRDDFEENSQFLRTQMDQSEVRGSNVGDIGTFSTWEKVETDLAGPDSNGLSDQPNPFTILVDVHFVSPEGKTLVVPAFYNGDSLGNLDGNKWKVRFSTGVVGDWSFFTVSAEPLLNGAEGKFNIVPSGGCEADTPEGLPDFNCMGRLEYVGDYYLRFAHGEYWIKGGIDDPENFLGDAFGDWNAKKEAIDYLASQGVNSIYVITNNINGDRKDTWPWLGDTQSEAKANSDRFDLPKLQEWEDFFTYVQNRGIVLHVVLNDDSAWNGYDHGLYYREMVAQFGYHPAIIWNIGEEANEIYSNSQQDALAEALQNIDPFNHPVTVHRKADWPFMDNPNFDLTSIQLGDGADDFSSAKLGDYNRSVIDHRDSGKVACHTIPIMIDETPRVTSVDGVTRVKMRSEVLYPIYFGGGNYELHYYDKYGGGTATIQDLEPMLNDMRRARQYVESLPFDDLKPCNDLLPKGTRAFCYGKSTQLYAIYIPENGEVDVNLADKNAIYAVNWFNPRTGEVINESTIEGGSWRSFRAPDNKDWVLRLSTNESSHTTTEDQIRSGLKDYLLNLIPIPIYLPLVINSPDC
ncbi:MAG: DUF5060 domain-containing protein [Anaerolineales bacterium]